METRPTLLKRKMKRPRGRPRIHPPPDPNAPKRPRGRPKKPIPESPFSGVRRELFYENLEDLVHVSNVLKTKKAQKDYEFLGNEIPVPSMEDVEKYKNKYDPVQKELKTVQLYHRKPLLFWKNELGVSIDYWKDDIPPEDWDGMSYPLWSRQREIVRALIENKKVAVKSGHGNGKTFIAAGLALEMAYVFKCIVLTTAPTFRQVRRILWSEIHQFYNHAPHPLGGKLNQVSLDLGDRWFMEGFATDKPMENVTGIHEENICVIVDEAGGVPNATFDAFEGILTSENSYVLYIGNPIEPAGPFFEAFKPGSGFHPITISCYDCPNVRHDRLIYPKLVSPSWVRDKEKKWGVSSALFRSRVLGEFPEEQTETLIPLRYIQQAQDRDLPEDGIVAFGLDIARKGMDRTVYTHRHKSGRFSILGIEQKERVPHIIGRMKGIYNETKKNVMMEIPKKDEEGEEKVPLIPAINVDDIGVGGGVVDDLEEDGYPVNGINSSEPPDTIEDPEADKIFLNKRAQYYWKLRQAFIDGKVSIDKTDDELAFELSKITTDYLKTTGKIKISDKEDIRKEIGKSPDLADAMMLCFAIDGDDGSEVMVRFI